MKRSSLFGHTIELLDEVRASQNPADQIVRDFFRTRHYLGSKDRRYVSETLFGILRNMRFLQETLGASDPALRSFRIVPAILFVIAWELKFSQVSVDALLPEVGGLWRVYLPDLKCEETLTKVQAVDLAATFAQDPVHRIAVQCSFPDGLVREWMERFGDRETEALCNSLNEPAPVTIRANTLKTNSAMCRDELLSEGVESHPTRLAPDGLILAKRINTQALASFKQGLFEMQDEGSQLISLLTGVTPGMTVVDACAGGGGKTLHLAALMQNQGRLVAIDVQERRLNNIRERLSRAGAHADVLLAGRDRENIATLNGRADVVLVDAPCTGVGTFRRNPWAKMRFQEDAIKRVSAVQHSVLRDSANLVRPGGRLVYSTCTLTRRENEDIVETFLRENSAFTLEPAGKILDMIGIYITASPSYLLLLPHQTGTDGFFAAVLTKSLH